VTRVPALTNRSTFSRGVVDKTVGTSFDARVADDLAILFFPTHQEVASFNNPLR
jgi:hypothetical protein